MVRFRAHGAPAPPVVAPSAPLAAPPAAPPAEPEWVAYTPPPRPGTAVAPDADVVPPIWQAPDEPAVPAASETPLWDMPAGFVPLQAPRRKHQAIKLVAIAAVVAAIGGLAWFGYQSFKPGPANPAPIVAGPAATVTYTSSTGHFTVGLPEQPVTTTVQQTQGQFTLKESVAAAESAHENSPPGSSSLPGIPAGRMADFMRGAAGGIARTGQVSNLQPTTYQGHPAITATATGPDSKQLSILFFAYSSTHMYMLAAPDDATLSALEAHFKPTP